MITKKIGQEFPDIITTGSFGKTWEDRDLMYIKLDARPNRSKSSSLSETESSSSSSEEKKESSSSTSGMTDDDFLKTLGKDVGNVYVQLDSDIKSIKKNLNKNLKLAQVNHIDNNLLKLKDEEDSSSQESSSGSTKTQEDVKSVS